MTTDVKRAFWGKCRNCGHCWPVVWLPMEAIKAAKLMLAAWCPNCASDRIGIADQHHGELREDASGAPETSEEG